MVETRSVGSEFLDVLTEVEGEFAVEIDGEPVRLLTLPPGVFAEIQEDTGLSWADVLRGPINQLDVAERLVRAAATKAGKPVPPVEDTAALIRLFVRVGGTELPEVDASEAGEENPTAAS